MARYLHLLKHDSPPMSAIMIDRHRREPGSEVTVIRLDGAAAAPAGLPLRTVGADLDWAQLLDLIFASDHVVTW